MGTEPEQVAIDNSPAADNKTIIWQEATTKDGRRYQTGVENAQAANAGAKPDVVPATEEAAAVTEGARLGSVEVNWPFPSEGNPPLDFQHKTGIVWYRVWPSSGFGSSPLFKWEIQICTSIANRGYTFYDEDGGSYSVDCYLTGKHYVQYGSDKPGIKRVTYSKASILDIVMAIPLGMTGGG